MDLRETRWTSISVWEKKEDDVSRDSEFWYGVLLDEIVNVRFDWTGWINMHYCQPRKKQGSVSS